MNRGIVEINHYTNETAIRWKTIYFQLNLYWFASICYINIFLAGFSMALLVFCCVNSYTHRIQNITNIRGWECDECVFTVYNLMFRLNYTHRVLLKIDFCWNSIEYNHKPTPTSLVCGIFDFEKKEMEKIHILRTMISIEQMTNSTSVEHKFHRHNDNMSFWYWTFLWSMLRYDI